MCASNPYLRELPKTQATSPLAACFQCFSPRWSAFWAPHHLEPRPRCRQAGGIALHEPPRGASVAGCAAAKRGKLHYTRIRHAGDTPPEGFAWRKTPITTPTRGAGASTTAKLRHEHGVQTRHQEREPGMTPRDAQPGPPATPRPTTDAKQIDSPCGGLSSSGVIRRYEASDEPRFSRVSTTSLTDMLISCFWG